MKRWMGPLALGAVVGLSLITTNVAAAPAQAGALASLHEFLANTRTFKASFTQTIVGKSSKKPQVSSGTVSLSRPGKFRWEVSKPFQQLLVGDGSKVWLFDADLKQVTVRKMADTLGGTPAALLAGEVGNVSAIEKNFLLSEAPAKNGLAWVEARPKSQDGSFDRVRLGFKNDQLLAMEMHDQFGQVTTVEFSAVERNPGLAPALFRFTPPAGVDVVGE